jgi:hypothetical protein
VTISDRSNSSFSLIFTCAIKAAYGKVAASASTKALGHGSARDVANDARDRAFSEGPLTGNFELGAKGGFWPDSGGSCQALNCGWFAAEV